MSNELVNARIIKTKIRVPSGGLEKRAFTELPKTMIGDPFICPNANCGETLEQIIPVRVIELPEGIDEDNEIKYGKCPGCHHNKFYFMPVETRRNLEKAKPAPKDRRVLEADEPLPWERPKLREFY